MIARPYAVSSTLIQNSAQFVEAFKQKNFLLINNISLIEAIILDKGYDF